MKRAIKDHWKDFAAILGLLIVAGGISGFILTKQRFRFPVIQDKPVRMYAELDNAQAVTPGQGQTVEVAGVKIGLIANVELRDGRAVVGLDIEKKFDDLIREDASALLRPRTGLKDMFLQIDPGSKDKPLAKDGFTIASRDTMTDVNLDEILAVLDRDTRDHLQLLLGGAARGLEGRETDLAELFRRYGPTVRDLRRVNQAVAVEREGLKDAVNGLSLLTEELATKDDDLAQLVDSSAAVFEAFASESSNVSATVDKLPEALRTTTRTLGDVQRLADELGPASTALTPAFVALDRTNEVLEPTARALAPVLRDEIRPFVKEARPLVADLRPAANGLAKALPDLTGSFVNINRLLNMLAFNPNGQEPADKADRQEGYLFWLAWLTHQTANLINVDDANGPMRPIFLTGTCQTLTGLVNGEPALEFALGVSDLLANLCNNPQSRSVDVEGVEKALKRSGKAFDRQAKDTRKLLGVAK